MKMKLITIFLSALILFSVGKVNAGLAEVYFPLNVGNSWTYIGYEADWGGGEPIQKEYTFTIIGTEEIDGFTYYKFDDYFNVFSPPPNDEWPVTMGREMLFRYDTEDKVLMRPKSSYGYDIVRYDFTGNDWNPIFSIGWCRIKQYGLTCNVPGGQFSDCINFQLNRFTGEEPDAYANGEYLAPNVGNIKFVRPGGSFLGLAEGQYVTFELENYTIVPEPSTILLLGLGIFLIKRKSK